MTQYFNGQCHCGKIKFTCVGEPVFTQYCHCNKCREIASMSNNPQDKVGYSYTAAYLTQNFSIITDENSLEELTRQNSKLLLCASCKSLIYGISLDPDKQGGIGINVNNFNLINASFNPIRHTWYVNRIIDFNDDLPKFKDTPKEQFGSGEILLS